MSVKPPIRSIRTNYQGVSFRSRLEARWAAFFTTVGWDWSYEPFDLRGWEPDFKIATTTGKTLLIEVKPASTLDDEHGQEGARDIERCTYRQPFEAILVGLEPFTEHGLTYLGWMPEQDGEGFHWDKAAVGTIAGDQLYVCHASGSHHCRICGANEGWVASMDPVELKACWAKACNETQWRPKL